MSGAISRAPTSSPVVIAGHLLRINNGVMEELKEDLTTMARSTAKMIIPVSELPAHHHHKKAEEAILLAMHWIQQATLALDIQIETQQVKPEKFSMSVKQHDKLYQMKKQVDGAVAMAHHLLLNMEVPKEHLMFFNAVNQVYNELVTCSFWLDRAAGWHRMKELSRQN